MGCLETDPGGESEGQASQLNGEQADDAGQKRERKQQDGILQEEDNAGDDQGQESECVSEVITELVRLHQEQLRDTVQPSPELSHVEHCNRGSLELRSSAARSVQIAAAPCGSSAILTPFSGHPREIYAPNRPVYAHHAGRWV